jgi:hypothetical protein
MGAANLDRRENPQLVVDVIRQVMQQAADNSELPKRPGVVGSTCQSLP